MRHRLERRMREVGLRLHPEKTKVVYCKDHMRQEQYQHTSFAFLGFTFRQRKAQHPGGQHYSWFLPAIATEALKAKSKVLRRLRIHLRTRQSLSDLARCLNPIVAGWMNYYGRYYRSQLYPLLRRVNTYLRRWAARKYKRLWAYKRFKRWWAGIQRREPGLFAQWQWVHSC